jgi:agmatine deiminase
MTLDRSDDTPRTNGFRMPAEWDLHAACLMAWPTRTELWGALMDAAKGEYAAVARAIADFEPVLMVCNPGQEAEVRNACGSGVEALPIGINDSWARDSGPIFVRDDAGTVALVDFEFNAWGERWHPFDLDNALPAAVASHLGMRRFSAPMVLEGGAIMVDGEGTLLTTEQCLLNPNRNPKLTRTQMEQVLGDYLGVSQVVWLENGHSLDVGPAGTDGHIDGVAQYVAPGHVLLEMPTDPSSPDYQPGQANFARLQSARDAAGRPFVVSRLDPGPDPSTSYVNGYVANGAVIVPTGGQAQDQVALGLIADLYPDREVVGVPGVALAEGGGGVHCITQQVPATTCPRD